MGPIFPMTTILVVVPCSRRKIWDRQDAPVRVKARDVYVGPLTRLAIRYAESRNLPYVILSGKYGFLHPWEEIENYDQKLRLNRRFILLLQRQVYVKRLYMYSKVVCLCPGRTYTTATKLAFLNTGVQVECPLEGLDYVTAMKKLSSMLSNVS